MAEQTVTLRITSDAKGLVTGVGVANAKLAELGNTGQQAGQRAAAGLGAAQRGVEGISKQLRNLQNLASVWAAFAGVRAVVRDLVSAADAMTSLNAQLRIATGSTEAYAQAQQTVQAVAISARSDLESVATLYTRLAQSSKSLGISQQELGEITEAVSMAVTLSGGSAASAAAGVQQLAQAFASGVLSGDEFRSVMENSPRVVKALTDTLGVSVGELRKLAEQQKLTADIVADSLRLQLTAMQAEMTKMPQTVGQALGQVSNAWSLYVNNVNQAAGVTGSLAQVLDGITTLLMAEANASHESAGGLEFLASGLQIVTIAGVAFKNVVEVIVNGVAMLADIVGTVTSTIGTLLANSIQSLQEYQSAILRLDFEGAWRAVADGNARNMAAIQSAGRQIAIAYEAAQAGVESAHNDIAKSWAALTEVQARAVKLTGEQMATLGAQFSSLKTAFADGGAGGIIDGIKSFGAALYDMAKGPQDEIDELRKRLMSMLGGVETGAKSAAKGVENLYTHTTRLSDATSEVDTMLRSLAYGLADEGTRALMDYEDVQARILDLELQWLDLGPMSEAQIAKLAELRKLAADTHAKNLADLNAETVRDAQWAAEQSARAWEGFTYDLASAIADGTSGVKRWWKAMLDDMKRQLIQSGLLKLMQALFGNKSSGLSLAGSGGTGFGSILSSLFGVSGTAGGAGGNLFSGLATAISGGVSSGLMGLGGTLAGLGMGGLGGGLAWAGGSVAANGLFGGLGGSFMTGMGNLFGAGGGALMGIGQMIPAIAAIAGVAAAIQKISGGKLFGTSYGFDSAGRTLDFSATGASGQDRVTEVRQRSLFRGRSWRDTYSDLPDDVADSIGEFWDAVTASNIAIAGDAARTIGAQIKQEFDKDGKVTSTIVEVIGRQYRESMEEAMTRIAAENTIANIDAMLGTTAQGTGPGFGGNGPGFGGGGDFDRGGFDAVMEGIGYTVAKTTQTVGEAFAIAERWRSDANLLAEGAQMLLLAATDIKAGAGLLGEGGTLTQIADLIEELQAGSETLSETYARVAGSAALLDQALALSGVQIDGTREHIVRFATSITDAAGGLAQAQALWNSYFANFYSAAELAQYNQAQLNTAAVAAFAGAGLDLSDYIDAGGMQRFRADFEAAMPTMSAEDIAAWLRAADALAAVTASARAIDATLADNAWNLYLDGLSEGDRAVAELTRQYDDMRASLLATGATTEQLTTLELQRAEAMGRLMAAQAQALWSSYFQNFYSAAELAAYQAQQLQQAAQAAFAGAGLDLSQYIDAGGMERFRADFEAAMPTMSAEDIAAWLRAADALAAVTAAARAIDADIAVGAWQQYLDGLTDTERAIAESTRYYDDWRDSLIAAGATAEQLAAVEEQRAVAMERLLAAEEAQRAAAESARVADLIATWITPAADAAGEIRQTIADMGLSDYAREQAQIARETQQALADAAAAGASPVELLAIEIAGLEHAAAAAALAAANFAGELGDWEFEDYLAGLSDADAQRARLDRQWESRYMRAVEIFGEGSEEAIRVLGLWDNAVARLSQTAQAGAEAVRHATALMGDIFAAVKTWAEKLNESIAHLRPGEEMESWISELSGLPRLAQQAVRRPLAEVVQLIRSEYLDAASDLQAQILRAQQQLEGLPWHAQAEMHTLEAKIAALQAALGSIGGSMGNALEQLKQMYLASLQGVRDYLDSMVLGDLSVLSPAERIAEAWDQLNAAVEAGEGDAATRLADTYLRLLREFEASGEDYNDGFYAVRELLEGMFDIDWDALLGPDVGAASDSDNIAHMAGAVDAQLAAAEMANEWLAQIASNTGGGWGLPSYDVGTYNVPATGPAILHAGEMVLPRPMADAMRQGAFGSGGDTKALEAKLDGVIQRLDKLDRTTAAGAQQVAATVAKTGEISDRNNDASRARNAQAQRRGVTA